MYSCSVKYPIACLDKANESLGCCPVGTGCSSWGCVRQPSEGIMYVDSTSLFWTSTGLQLAIFGVGLVEFIVGTLYYWCRRQRTNQRVQRSIDMKAFVNEEAKADEAAVVSSGRRRPLRRVSELNGRCCGCGGVADTVLLPCRHAVCCYSCSAQAKLCPFCNATSSARQRLFPV